ncbi:MAG: leucine-rich repeat protein, partial [Clostridiales bacterium]|nr:leucine-rich repeat protein [Clostridiales bacterium]
TALTTVNFLDDVTSIGGSTFKGCTNLSNITIPNGVTSIGSDAFYDCDSITDITIPDSVTSIGSDAFMYCDGITSIVIPDSVTSIGSWAFYCCTNLTSVVIPTSVTSIGNVAFSGCSNIESITVGQVGLNYGWNGRTALTTVNFLDDVTSIGGSTFKGCTNLSNVTIPDGVTSIGSSAFYNCTNLTDVYYSGSESEWSAISIGTGNECLTGATIHFNSSGGSSSGDSGSSGTFDEDSDSENTKSYSDLSDVTVDAVNSTADDVISESDIENLRVLESISLGQDEINGPSVTVLGKTFYLFQLDGKLSIKLGSKLNLQFKVDEDNKTIQALIGFKEIDEKTEVGQEKWKDMYSQTKSLYKALNDSSPSKSAYDNLRKLNTNLRDQGNKLFLNIEGKIAGYLEWAYESGSFDLSEGGIIITAKASGDFYTRIPAFPASYGTVGLEVSAEGKFSIKDDRDYDALSVSSSLAFKPEINVGVGLGSRDFHIEGGLKGSLTLKILAVTGYFADVSTDYDPFTVTAEGSVYVEGKAGIFTASNSRPVYGPEQWFPAENSVSLSSVASVDMSDAKLISRNYLYNGSVSTMSFDPLTSFDKVSLYPYNSPQLAVFDDGTRLLIWTDDDGTKGDADITSLFSSFYDGTSWGEYTTVWDNDGYNGDPVVYCDGTKAYVLWQRIAESLSADTDMEEHMSKTDLYCSVYENGEFSEPVLISNADRLTYESIYDISSDGENIAVCWVENSENDLFMTEGTNTIYIREYTDGVWQDEEIIASTDSSVTDAEAYMSEGSAKVMYTLYNSSDETTSLYINEDGTIVYYDTYSDDCGSLQIDGDELYHIADDELYIYGITSGKDTSTGITDISNFEVITNGDNKAVLSLVSTGFTCEMYVSRYNGETGSWGNMIKLTDYEKYIRNYSAVLKDDGNILMAVNLVDVNEDYAEEGGELYGTAELKVIESSEYNDLILNYFTYDSEDAIAGGELPIEFNVTNSSLNSIDTVYAVLTDENGDELAEETISCDIEGGESADLTLNWTLPESMVKQDITLTVSCDYDDMDPGNNSETTDIGLANIEITNLVLDTTESGAAVTAYIKNSGYETAENVSVSIYDSSVSGTQLETAEIGSLEPGVETAFVFSVPSEYYRLFDETILYALYFEAVTDTTEADYSTNGKKILFGDLGINILIGDLDSSGKADGADAALLLKYVSSLSEDDEAINTAAADFNQDGKTDILDVIELLKSVNETASETDLN